jgi:hypothetical protein
MSRVSNFPEIGWTDPRNLDFGRARLNRNNPPLFRRLFDDPQESKVVFESLGVGPIEL